MLPKGLDSAYAISLTTCTGVRLASSSATETNTSLSLRSDCANAATALACNDEPERA